MQTIWKNRQIRPALPQALSLLAALFFSIGASGAKTVSGGVSADEPDRLVPLKFNVTFDEDIYSKEARVGDPFEAHLTSDLRYKNALIAQAGTRIVGHIRELTPSRTLMQSATHNRERFRRHSSLVLQFDQIMESEDTALPICGVAAEQVSVFNNDGRVREIKVGPQGELMKAGNVDAYQVPSFGVPIPESILPLPGHFQVKLISGDQLTVQATAHTQDLASLSVSVKVLPRLKRSASQNQPQ